jgi:hypothetical protein
LGAYLEAESSFRVGIPDYPFHFKYLPAITTGIRTGDPAEYPIQATLIDNIPNLYRSDAISQFNINGLETRVTIERGETLTDIRAFERCGHPLLPGVYRKWMVLVETEGHRPVTQEVIVPDASARYMVPADAITFYSEYLHMPGAFTVQYWGLESIRESDPVWRPLSDFVTNGNYDGSGTDFGVRVMKIDDQYRVEFSNRAGNAYLPKSTKFSLPP